MKRFLPVFSSLVVLATVIWFWALRDGPGLLALRPLDPWPKALAAVPEPAAGVTLGGTLLRLDGTPAADALIEVGLPGGVRWSWTDGAGEFLLTGLPADNAVRAELEFVALAREHMPATFRTQDAPGTRVEWILSEPTGELEALPELISGDYTGRVVRGMGPTEGLEVWLTPPPGTDPLGGQVERRATVDASGSFSVPGLTAGVYRASILPGWARGGSWPILGEGALPFEPGSSLPTPRLSTSEGVLTGRVFDDHGQPLAGAMLLVRSATEPGRLWPPVQSDLGGFCRVADLPPGVYHLELVSGQARQELEVRVEADAEAVARFDLLNI